MATLAFRCRQVKPVRTINGEEQATSHQPQPLTNWKHSDDCFSTDWQSWSSNGERRAIKPTDVIPYRAITIMWCQRYQNIWIALCDCTLERQDDEWIKSDPDLSEKHPFYSEWHEPAFTKEPSGLWRIGVIGEWAQLPVNCPCDNFYDILPRNLFKDVPDQTPEPPPKRCDLFGDLAIILGLLALWPHNPKYITSVIQDSFYQANNPLFDPQYKPKAMDRSSKFIFLVLRSFTKSF